MSHANGQARLSNGRLLWFEYNGTADIIMPWLYADYDDLLANWRRGDEAPKCSCPPSSHQLAMLSTDYGYGSHWPGLVCEGCMLIVSDLWSDNWDYFEVPGFPDWDKPYRRILEVEDD